MSGWERVLALLPLAGLVWLGLWGPAGRMPPSVVPIGRWMKSSPKSGNPLPQSVRVEE